MANEIIITVKNQIEAPAEAPETPVPASPKTKEKDNIKGAITAQFLVSGANRLLAATGNQEFSSVVSKVARYGFAIGRAIAPPTPIGIATLAVTIASDALDKITDAARKQAQAENEVDNARIKAGLLDISQTKVQTKWFTSRQTYRRV